MNNRLKDLIEKEKLTDQEMEELTEMEEVEEIEDCGMSGHYIGWHYYNCKLINGEKYDIYTK